MYLPFTAFRSTYRIIFSGDGLGRGPSGMYVETDPTAPICRYGCHKLMGEIGALGHGAYVLRSAWLYGPGGKNFISKAYEFGQAKKKLTLDDVSYSSPTLSSNLAEYTLAVVETDQRESGMLYHCCDQGHATRWELFDYVRKQLEWSSDQWAVKKGPQYTSGTTRRPLKTPLDSSLFFRRFSHIKQRTIEQAVTVFVSQCRDQTLHHEQ